MLQEEKKANPLSSEQIRAVVLGSAVGDALGVPVEFRSRKQLDRDPVTGMRGYGTYPVPMGAWSDDTSMSLCALDVLADGTLDYDRIMENFGQWYYRDAYTPTGETFDAGRTCVRAIHGYRALRKPYTECGLDGEYDNGNGSLMRIAPFVLFLAGKEMPMKEKLDVIHTASALTHAHERAKVGCGIFSFVLWELLADPGREAVYRGLEKAERYYRENGYGEIGAYADLSSDLAGKARDEIKSSGYVVDTLTAAIYCLLTTDSYEKCVLQAVNLGEDTDTVADVAGALAGALYGLGGIPDEWMNTLCKREWIEEMCDRLALHRQN